MHSYWVILLGDFSFTSFRKWSSFFAHLLNSVTFSNPSAKCHRVQDSLITHLLSSANWLDHTLVAPQSHLVCRHIAQLFSNIFTADTILLLVSSNCPHCGTRKYWSKKKKRNQKLYMQFSNYRIFFCCVPLLHSIDQRPSAASRCDVPHNSAHSHSFELSTSHDHGLSLSDALLMVWHFINIFALHKMLQSSTIWEGAFCSGIQPSIFRRAQFIFPILLNIFNTNTPNNEHGSWRQASLKSAQPAQRGCSAHNTTLGSSRRSRLAVHVPNFSTFVALFCLLSSGLRSKPKNCTT